MRSFPEVKWVFFCCCFVHFCPFGQSKLRQFAIVWLHIQSSCMWHWVHNTPPAQTHLHPSSVAQCEHPACSFPGTFGTAWKLVELRTNIRPTAPGWTSTGRPPVFHSWFWVGLLKKKKKKYKTVVFIATVALSYARWPCWFNYEKAAGQSKRKKQC